jgi:prepilin-type N-terminal cleavage/methylation domain-containing protein
MSFNIKKNIKNKRAFTLMEIVVVMFILTVGMVAVLSLVRKSSEFQSVKKNLVTAAFLSQEGIDIMRNIRDTNVILGESYDAWDGITGNLVQDNEYYYKVDYLSLLATSTTDIDSSFLRENDGMFSHEASGEESIFKRMITVVPKSGYSYVESLVEWTEKGQTYDFKLGTNIYDLSY